MVDCSIVVNTCRGLIGLIGALSIIIGVIRTDSDYDNYGKTTSPVGAFFFFTGWILFASSIGLINNSVSGLIFDTKAFFGLLSSFLVLLAAALSQKVMYKKNTFFMRMHLIFFILSWIFVAYSISLST